jgi:hypothetical protein
MLAIFVGIVADCAIVIGLACILSLTVPRMPRNKSYRFVYWFVLLVPFTRVMNYVNVSTLGYYKLGWTGVFIIAFLVATFGTFWPTEPHDSNTPSGR